MTDRHDPVLEQRIQAATNALLMAYAVSRSAWWLLG